MTLMFDNGRSEKNAFALVRARAKRPVLFDARDPWLEKITGPFKPSRVSPPRKTTPKTAPKTTPKTAPRQTTQKTSS